MKLMKNKKIFAAKYFTIGTCTPNYSRFYVEGHGARGPVFDSRPRHLNFQRLVISCFQVEIWLKDR